jgi:branched-chain amino acid transport system substrate-binding protein
MIEEEAMRRTKFFGTGLFGAGRISSFILLVTCVLLLPILCCAQTGPIRLGVNLEVTGNMAWLGDPQLKALQMLTEDVNRQGGINGRKVELITYDNESNVEKAVGNAKKLIQRDKVVAVFGPSTNAPCRSTQPTMQEAKLTSYSLSASFDPNGKDSYWFAVLVSVYNNIEKFFDWYQSQGFTRIAQICSTDSSGQTWFDYSNEIVKKYAKMQLASQRFNVSDLDVTPQLTNLKSSNPQAIMVGSTGKSAGIVIKNFMQMGFKIPVCTGAGNVSPSFLDMIAGNEPDTLLLPGSRFVVYQDLPEKDPFKPMIKKFVDEYQKKFNKEADLNAAVGYDAARILFEAFKATNPSGPEDSTKVRDYIEKMRNFPGVYGANYNFSATDHRGLNKTALVLIQAKNKRFSLYETLR